MLVMFGFLSFGIKAVRATDPPPGMTEVPGPIIRPATPVVAPVVPITGSKNKSSDSQSSGFMVWLVSWTVLPIIRLEGVIISLEAYVLNTFMGYNGFVDSQAVVLGWTQVRDVANLFFVLILLAISLGTILRIESYNFKKMLPKVLIMAVLVNFSRTISGLIIDFSQVIMMTFAASFAGRDGDGHLVAILNIRSILLSGSQVGTNQVALSPTDLIASGILAVVMLLIAMIVLLVMLVVIIMRIVMLWLLVVLSPLPFILSAFPQGQKYAQQWWQEFTKYIIVGPALAFFIWLAFAVAGSSAGNQSGKISVDAMGDTTITAASLGGELKPNSQLAGVTISQPADKPGAAAGPATGLDTKVINEVAQPDQFISFIIAIGMLMGGLMLTQQLGVAGGSFAGSMANKIRQGRPLIAPLKLFGKGLGKAEKMLYGGTGIGLDPRRVFRGLSEHMTAWNDRMERQGATKGFGKAKEMVAGQRVGPNGEIINLEKGRSYPRNLARRFFGLGGMMMSSPADFMDNYGTFRGAWKGAKTLFKGTSITELEDWEHEKREKNDKLSRQEKLVHVGNVSEKGREQLITEAIDKNAESYEAGSHFFATEEVGGKTTVISMSPAELDAEMGKVKKADLKKYGLDPEILSDPKAGGIDVNDPESVDKFKKAFFGYHAGKMINDTGTYVDSANTIQKLTDTELELAGERYYDDQVKIKDDEISRVATGGPTDQQVQVRQNELESINQQMLKVLKSIESSNRTATKEEKFVLSELADKGERLGGKAVTDAVTGLQHFGLSSTDRDNIQQITPADFVGRAALTPEEFKQLGEKDDLGRSKLEQLKENRHDLSDEITLAKMKPEDRRIQQNKINDGIKVAREKLQKDDMEKKKRAIDVPIGYEALSHARAAEREELSKLPDSMEWTEIESELFSAMQMKNTARVRALMKKAAVDYNDNEIWRSFGYSQDNKGMKEFGDKELVGGLGMNRQEMLKFMDDVAYINEDKGHYDTARMVTLENGMARWSTEAEHAAAVANENLKKASRNFLQNTNRLGFGGDDAAGNYKLAMSGKLTLAGLGDKELQFRLDRGEFNPSTLSKIGSDIEGLEDMVRRGWLTRKTIDTIKQFAQRKTVDAAYSELYKQAKSATK